MMDRVVVEWITRRLAQQQVLAYALLDRDLKILDCHWLVDNGDPAQGGQDLPLGSIFPALIGLEDHLRHFARTPGGEMEIPQIARQLPNQKPIYYTLRVESIREFDAHLLVFALDATDESRMEQQLIQQRNELRLHVEARLRAEEALKQANDQLETRVQKRTIELQEANAQLRSLSRRLVEIQETERREIARELHDEIGQALTGLKLLLQRSARLPEDVARANVTEAQEMVFELMNRVRQLSLELRPTMLDDLGLLPTLLWHFDRFTAHTQINVRFKHAGIDRRFSSDVEITAYRIIQEALTNAARYANVNEISVRVMLSGDILGIQIDDRGKGFSLETFRPHGASVGLSSMRERVASLDGAISFDTAPGEGVHIHAQLPIGAQS